MCPHPDIGPLAVTGPRWLVVRWLVTGGAGYIGAHVVNALCESGLVPVVVDDLSAGYAARIPTDVALIRADVRDTVAMREAFRWYRPAGVIHLAARKSVAEAADHPLCYYRDNLDGLRSILAATVESGTRAVLFSSSAAVYGTPARCPVSELDPTLPENTYGRTKLVGEWMLRDAAATAAFRWTALRYFNVAGAAQPYLRDAGGGNLVPRLIRAAALGIPATVYGTDYPTPDGSAIRDYVHVADIADAHVRAALALVDGAPVGTAAAGGEIFNVGRGEGVSVLEMIAAVGRATGRALPHAAAPRRVGDPASVVASAERVAARLGWQARYGLDDIIRSAVGATATV